jgi:hypothetical protein
MAHSYGDRNYATKHNNLLLLYQGDPRSSISINYAHAVQQNVSMLLVLLVLDLPCHQIHSSCAHHVPSEHQLYLRKHKYRKSTTIVKQNLLAQFITKITNHVILNLDNPTTIQNLPVLVSILISAISNLRGNQSFERCTTITIKTNKNQQAKLNRIGCLPFPI